MNYDLRLKEDRKRFIKRCNFLLKRQRDNVSLTDESSRTLNQNSYIHVLCRILATDVGVTENYAKQIYFKKLSNRDIFYTTSKDPLTGDLTDIIRSTRDLTIVEMRRAITNFRSWAADNGYHLPEAVIKDDGSMEFASEQDKQAFHQAEIQTSKMEDML